MASKVYITHDANARNSKKMLRMRERLGPVNGPAAYGIYWMLIERLREEDNYISEKDYEMLAFDFRCDVNLLRMVVEDFGLFDIAEDGQTFGSHGLEERMAVMEARSEAGKRGARARYGKDKNGAEMAQDGKSEDLPVANSDFATGKPVSNKKEKNKINKTNTSSSLPSSPSDEEVSKDEQEQEEIVYYFTFQKNWAAPNKEYEELVEYNSGPQQKRKWDELTEPEKQAILAKWRQEPQLPKRFDDKFLHTWQKVYEALMPVVPYDVRMGLLDDEVGYRTQGTVFYLKVPRAVQPYLESNLDRFRRWLWPFVQSMGCEQMTYNIY